MYIKLGRVDWEIGKIVLVFLILTVAPFISESLLGNIPVNPTPRI